MKKVHQKGKIFNVVLLSVLAVVLSFSFAACTSGTADAKESAEFTTLEKEVKIAQITDTHYYPLAYCYSGNIADTDYEEELIVGSKLFVESSLMNIRLFEQIKTSDIDYLFVTGDLTLNGELQAHIEFANLLRNLQNEKRAAGNEDFQIFVTVGNHDMYNEDAVYFYDGGKKQQVSHLTTRYDITKIYSSLGYPDLSDAEIEEYYATLPTTDVLLGEDVYLPYEGNYINSTTAEGVEIDYQNTDIAEKKTVSDFDYGDITYIANTNGFSIVAMDEELSGPADAVDPAGYAGNHVGGLLYETTKAFLTQYKADGKFGTNTILGIAHHNIVPHFDSEGQLLKDFTIYSWEETADFLADMGMNYVFTGHMHSNDIATRTSFNGNLITDTETASVTGYKGGARFITLQWGKADSADAQKYFSRIELIKNIDFSKIYNEGYITQEYLDFYGLNQYVQIKSGVATCTDSSEYAVTKLLRNIVKTYMYKYLNPDLIAGLGTTVSNIIPANIKKVLSGVNVQLIVDNLIDHIEKNVLADYTYQGSEARYQGEGRGKKIAAYLDDLVTRIINIQTNSQGANLVDTVLNNYLRHVGGTDISISDATDAEKETFENLKKGTFLRDALDILMDENTGLMRIVNGLFETIDLSAGMTEKEITTTNSTLKGALYLLTGSTVSVDIKALDLNALSLKLSSFIKTLGLDLGGLNVEQFLQHTIDGYVTDSFFTSLGEIAHTIIYEFGIDETSKYETLFSDSETVMYKRDAAAAFTYISTEESEAPSVENGKLPSMLTVAFGADTATTKNFTWFTDRRVTGTDIQLMEGEFSIDKAINAAGKYELYATTTRSIDLGVFATLMHVEVGRHTVELSDLKPNTTYSYRVGSAVDDLWSPVYTFKTAPSDNQAFELLLMTDIQGSAQATYDKAAEVMEAVNQVFEDGYDFVINTGDLVDNSRNLEQWEYLLNTNAEFWGNTTQVVATGNHEKYAYEKPAENERQFSLTLPDAQNEAYNYMLLHYNLSYPQQAETVGTGAYYSFDYSNVHFTVLNTNDYDENGLGAAQLEWLKADLDNTTKQFKVVLMHKGLYSSGSHSLDTEVVAMRAQLTPIFSEKGVHIVLSGHDHTYSETYYLDKSGKIVETDATGKTKIGDEGTLYVTLGCFGDKFYNYVENENVPVEFGKDLHNPTLSKPTFGKLTYDGTNLYYTGYEYDSATATVSALRPAADEGLKWWQWTLIVAGGLALGTGSALIVAKRVKVNKEKTAA